MLFYPVPDIVEAEGLRVDFFRRYPKFPIFRQEFVGVSLLTETVKGHGHFWTFKFGYESGAQALNKFDAVAMAHYRAALTGLVNYRAAQGREKFVDAGGLGVGDVWPRT